MEESRDEWDTVSKFKHISKAVGHNWGAKVLKSEAMGDVRKPLDLVLRKQKSQSYQKEKKNHSQSNICRNYFCGSQEEGFEVKENNYLVILPWQVLTTESS